jgi:ferric-dicitrate binding protein FerR (iron transport regulator)
MRVKAGQQVRVVGGVLPAAAEPTDLRETTAWLERKIVFNERPLAAVAEEFNRYNSVTFTIEDPALRNLPISGAFDATDTESFAAFLGSWTGSEWIARPPASTSADTRPIRPFERPAETNDATPGAAP